ncbi:MAG TPA: 23S rRNA (pseudouridine(1915)-N(3))-methyltransferase RlmH [Xanthobacteraceae bacterium]|nr:23S rRNA (pseudouridine(1915)-N(3))-methyltransferase RlmH [Xanthobacteraceae bacterium]
MKLVVAAVGRLKAGPERDLAARYRERAAAIGRKLGFRSIEIVEIAESRGRRGEDRIREEAAELAAAIPENAAIVALDARGKALSSIDLAERLERWRDQGTPAVIFLIGGADGLAERWRGRAELALCFGAATWPHQLVRIMLLEQIYRAMTILSGHPYHRE